MQLSNSLIYSEKETQALAFTMFRFILLNTKTTMNYGRTWIVLSVDLHIGS